MATVHKKAPTVQEVAEQAFGDLGCRFDVVDGAPLLRANYTGENGAWSILVQTREDPRRLFVYSMLPANVPPRRRPEASEYLTRANFNLAIGNFEMSFDTGEVRYKVSQEFDPESPTPELVKRLAYLNFWTVDRYLPGLMAVVYAGAAPAEALQKLEAEPLPTAASEAH